MPYIFYLAVHEYDIIEDKIAFFINLDEALEDYKRIIELDPNNNEARRAIATLPQRVRF